MKRPGCQRRCHKLDRRPNILVDVVRYPPITPAQPATGWYPRRCEATLRQLADPLDLKAKARRGVLARVSAPSTRSWLDPSFCGRILARASRALPARATTSHTTPRLFLARDDH